MSNSPAAESGDSPAPKVDRRRILAIDGGGLRGVIPVCILASLEAHTGRAVRDDFRFLAGTSTGAIIVAALAAGLPAAEILKFYEEDASTVFARHWFTWAQRLVFGRMYSTHALRAAIENRLPPEAKGWLLNQVPNEILVTATKLRDGRPWFFVKDQPNNSSKTGAVPLLECVVASAAAPTYFDPWLMSAGRSTQEGVVPRERELFVDGGVTIAGNPIYMACVEAFEFSTGYVPASTLAVSLGTGIFIDQTRPTHLLSWLNWIVSALLRSPGEQQTGIAFRQYVLRGMRLYRIDAQLRRDMSIDSVQSVPELRRIGEKFAATLDWTKILAGEWTHEQIDVDNTTSVKYSQLV